MTRFGGFIFDRLLSFEKIAVIFESHNTQRHGDTEMEIHTDDYVSAYYTDLFSEMRLMGIRSHADRRFWYAANNYVELVRHAVMDDFGTLVDVSGAANPLLKEQ